MGVDVAATRNPARPELPASRRRSLVRVGLLAAVVGFLFLWAALSGQRPSSERIEEWVDGFGAWGPLIYVGLSAALSCVFVPGPLLAGVAGALFGSALGSVVALAASTLAATAQLLITRYVAGRQANALLPERAHRLDSFLERRGFVAVFLVRLIPGVPYVLTNYSAGLTRLRARDMAAGTALGAAPKTYAYVTLVGSFGDWSRPEWWVALAMLVVLSVFGVRLARRELASERARGSGT